MCLNHSFPFEVQSLYWKRQGQPKRSPCTSPAAAAKGGSKDCEEVEVRPTMSLWEEKQKALFTSHGFGCATPVPPNNKVVEWPAKERVNANLPRAEVQRVN